MKCCGIIALGLIVVGVTIGITGRTVAGSDTIEQVLEDVTGGRFHLYSRPWWYEESVILGREPSQEQGIDYGYCEIIEEVEVSQEPEFDWSHEVYQGYSVRKYSLGSDINKLDIQMLDGQFTTDVSDDGSLYLEADGSCRLQGYVEDGTLYVKAGNDDYRWNNSFWVTLYIPENFYFDEVDVEMGAGELYFDNLTAKEASLEVGAGNITIYRPVVEELDTTVATGSISLIEMEVGDLDVDVAMGQLDADGAVNGNVDVECSMGYVGIGLEGNPGDFNYKVESGMGSIDVEGLSAFNIGFGQNKKIDNGADKNIDVECSMGAISIWFY